MPIAPSRSEAGHSRFSAGAAARSAPAASAPASSAVKNQRQNVSASGGSQPAARRATRMLLANIAGAAKSSSHAPIGVFTTLIPSRLAETGNLTLYWGTAPGTVGRMRRSRFYANLRFRLWVFWYGADRGAWAFALIIAG